MRRKIKAVLEERRRLLSNHSALLNRSRVIGRSTSVDLGSAVDVWAGWNSPRATSSHFGALESPQLSQALERANLADFGFESAGEESLSGALVLLRGVAGELLVIDSLSAGEFPGPRGSTSAELLGFYEPGSDLRFEVNGRYVNANVKIANGSRPIAEHFAAHPHVPVVFASADAASAARNDGFAVVDGRSSFVWPANEKLVVDIGITSEEIEQSLTTALGLNTPLVTGLEFVPLATIASIIVRAIAALRRKEELSQVLIKARRDSVAGVAGLTTGNILSSVGAAEPLSAAGALLGTALWRSALEIRSNWGEAVIADLALRSSASELVRRLPDQTN